MFAGASVVFAVAVEEHLFAVAREELESGLPEAFVEGDGEGVGVELGGEEGVGIKDRHDAVGIENGHTGGDVIGLVGGTLNVGGEFAGKDGEGLNLTELRVVASASEAGTHVERFEPFNPAFAPPCITSAALGAKTSMNGFGKAWGVGVFRHLSRQR